MEKVSKKSTKYLDDSDCTSNWAYKEPWTPLNCDKFDKYGCEELDFVRKEQCINRRLMRTKGPQGCEIQNQKKVILWKNNRANDLIKKDFGQTAFTGHSSDDSLLSTENLKNTVVRQQPPISRLERDVPKTRQKRKDFKKHAIFQKVLKQDYHSKKLKDNDIITSDDLSESRYYFPMSEKKDKKLAPLHHTDDEKLMPTSETTQFYIDRDNSDVVAKNGFLIEDIPDLEKSQTKKPREILSKSLGNRHNKFVVDKQTDVDKPEIAQKVFIPATVITDKHKQFKVEKRLDLRADDQKKTPELKYELEEDSDGFSTKKTFKKVKVVPTISHSETTKSEKDSELYEVVDDDKIKPIGGIRHRIKSKIRDISEKFKPVKQKLSEVFQPKKRFDRLESPEVLVIKNSRDDEDSSEDERSQYAIVKKMEDGTYADAGLTLKKSIHDYIKKPYRKLSSKLKSVKRKIKPIIRKMSTDRQAPVVTLEEVYKTSDSKTNLVDDESRIYAIENSQNKRWKNKLLTKADIEDLESSEMEQVKLLPVDLPNNHKAKSKVKLYRKIQPVTAFKRAGERRKLRKFQVDGHGQLRPLEKYEIKMPIKTDLKLLEAEDAKLSSTNGDKTLYVATKLSKDNGRNGFRQIEKSKNMFVPIEIASSEENERQSMKGYVTNEIFRRQSSYTPKIEIKKKKKGIVAVSELTPQQQFKTKIYRDTNTSKNGVQYLRPVEIIQIPEKKDKVYVTNEENQLQSDEAEIGRQKVQLLPDERTTHSIKKTDWGVKLRPVKRVEKVFRPVNAVDWGVKLRPVDETRPLTLVETRKLKNGEQLITPKKQVYLVESQNGTTSLYEPVSNGSVVIGKQHRPSLRRRIARRFSNVKRWFRPDEYDDQNPRPKGWKDTSVSIPIQNLPNPEYRHQKVGIKPASHFIR